MLKTFARYTSVGVVNTLIHWVVFAAMFMHGQTQSLSNFAAFCFAVTFSFFANAKWTFNSEVTTIRYLLYLFFMGALASAVGHCADMTNASPVITLITFSAISLVCGFFYSRFIVFRGKK